ncbi:hypothetical protein D9611_002521 [Ephemerocybe angulata]|uniref:DNA mismatch repair protein S5 domain-containing protein n=1 Tax=Ephemerocybe angulata TaxID=980116 RepID=A0A8H5FED6_9AGAR|nr:hypothetical protein D9611_002521 [Tulosesus angulatus]
MSAEIERIDLPTQSRLRSTQILTSMPQIVSELLQNALDADASVIEIGLDAQEWTCWVKDNGHGLSKNALEIIGQESDSGRYSTSKVYAQNLMNAESTFGFRGEALASAAELSCLEISSRTAQSKESWSVIVKGGKRLYLGPSIRWRRETPGTVVCVRDAFYNLPVRRLSHSSPTKTWELVRQELERYAIIFHEVAFTMEGLNSSKEGASNEDRIIRILKTPSTVVAFQRLYGRSLTENVEMIDTTNGETKIQGFISLVASYSKNYQHICKSLYVNRHPLESSDLHRMVNSCFSRSSFGRTALNEDGEADFPTAGSLNTVYQAPWLTEYQGTRRSPRKAEKRPIFVLNINVPPSRVDNCLEPGKSSVVIKDQDSIERLLFSIVDDFLQKHGFSPSSRPPFESGSPLPETSEADIFNQASSNHRRVRPLEQSTSSEPFFSVVGESDRISWTDPSTGDTFVIDSRTGNSLGQMSRLRTNGMEDTAPGGGFEDRRTLKLRGSASPAEPSDVPTWLSRALDENTAYAVVEQRLPSLTSATPDQRMCSQKGAGNTPFSVGNESIQSARHIPRQQLRHARVIAQVDRKFVACLLTSERSSRSAHSKSVSSCQDTGTTLVLVDQHAADERIRVESFLKPLCLGFLYSRSGGMNPEEATPITRLIPPRRALLTRHEASLLKRNAGIRELFRCWGISFMEMPENDIGSSVDVGSSDDYVQVLVTSLPEVLADKLRRDNELQAVLKISWETPSMIGSQHSGVVLEAWSS